LRAPTVLRALKSFAEYGIPANHKQAASPIFDPRAECGHRLGRGARPRC
jgi:hypothetical protein